MIVFFHDFACGLAVDWQNTYLVCIIISAHGTVLIFPPLTEGCSEDLDAFRFFFKFR